MTTIDLSNGWFATLKDDGTLTIRNPDQGRRFDLGAEEVSRLREILAQVPTEA